MDCITNGRSLQGAVFINNCSRDAWLARRLLRGLHEPSDIEVASPGFRPVAERMASHLHEGSEREVILNEWLELLNDDAFVDDFDTAMNAANPNGPPPADEPESVAGDDDWLPSPIYSQTPTARLLPLTGPGEDKTPDVLVRRASDIEPLTVEWLWRDRLPLGMLSMFAGDPKLGKSFVTVALAAAVSRGASFPHGDVPDGPGSVVLMSAEDDPARTIVPRLKSAGANLDKVHIFEAVKTTDGGDRLPSLAADIDRLGGIIERTGDCRLVVIDPITSYLGGVDDHRNAELRGVLSPLKAMAERLNVAVVLVTHLNKGQGTNGKHRVTGSIAYVGACRANFLFCRDHENPARVLMLDNGCNLAGEVPTLAYRIDDLGDGPTVVWDAEPVSITADEALQAQTDGRREQDHEEARECDRWLRGTLAAGPIKARELYGFAADAGFSKDQLKRAKQRIGVVSDRNGFGDGSAWFWSLRNESDAAVEDDERGDETPY